MTPAEVRPFRRADREQLVALVNAHVHAVVPGVVVSVNTVLSQLEREADEFIVDPWVTSRHTLVAEHRGRVVAAAHLLRYGDDPAVGESYRNAAELRWLVCWPAAPFWPDAAVAGRTLAAAAAAWLDRSGARRIYANGALPAPGVYGVPEQWPHVRHILLATGFRPGDRTEAVLMAETSALSDPPPALATVTLSRTLGINGTRFTALLDGTDVGYVEVEARSGDAGRIVQAHGLADVGNLQVAPEHRRRGIGRWLLGQAAEWLRLGHIDRLLGYCPVDEQAYLAFLRGVGFRTLGHTTLDWERVTPDS
jgi:GNAT superfamily N-acetyltransferase